MHEANRNSLEGVQGDNFCVAPHGTVIHIGTDLLHLLRENEHG